MKPFLVLCLSLSFFTAPPATFAAEKPTAAETFLDRFVQTLNDRLETTNAERTLKGGRLYCAQISDEQLVDLQALLTKNQDLNKVTVEAFALAAADKLSCYPTFWPTKGRSSVGGFLFNSKSFVMDHLLLREALNRFAGRTVDDHESLAQIFRP